jgi:transcription elongation factor Elf1
MESQRSTEKRYKKLLQNVAIDDYYKIDLNNRFNCYVCKCGHITKTVDIDAGVTPFMFSCEKCGNMATSTYYKDIAPEQQPTIEWYRPTLKQVLKLRKNEAMLDHVLNGGLQYRKRTV